MSKVNAIEKGPPPYSTYNKLLKVAVGEKKTMLVSTRLCMHVNLIVCDIAKDIRMLYFHLNGSDF